MALGISFIGLQVGFTLMVAAWVLMLLFLRRHPMTFTTRDPFSRWRQFLKGEGVPEAQKSAHRLIANLGIAGLAILGVSFVMFFIGGGPDALSVPPTP